MPEYLSLFTQAQVNLVGAVLRGETICPSSSLVEYSNLCDCTIGERSIVSGVVASGRHFPANTVTIGLHFNKDGTEKYTLFQYPIDANMKALFATQTDVDGQISLSEALACKSVLPTLASFSVGFDTKRVIMDAAKQVTANLPTLPNEAWGKREAVEIKLPVRLIFAGAGVIHHQ